MTKVVATVGLSVCLPPLAVICFGNPQIGIAPGLTPAPVKVVHVLGTAISYDQLIVLACVVVIAVVGGGILRFTDVGLAIKAMVDSPALTSVAGTSPDRIALGVWSAMTFLAGLTGVLIAPIVGLASADNFTILIASSFTAVIAAKLRHVGSAIGVGLLLGLLGGVLQKIVPSSNYWSSGSITSLPFVLTAGFVLYYARNGRAIESGASGGPLDRAIAVTAPTGGSPRRKGTDPAHPAGSRGDPRRGRASSRRRARPILRASDAGPLAILVAVAMLPLLLNGLWVGLVGLGLAYAVVFLSYTIITGEAGIISLCQITFAGLGGIATGQVATVYHWPALVAVLCGGLVADPVGLLLGLVSLRLGDLYLALVTLTFGVLVDNLVFTLDRFSQLGAGVVLSRPGFASGDVSFDYLSLAIFVLVALFAVNIRRSTTGLSVTAVRWSEDGARTCGLSVVQMKVLLTSVAAFVAGIGGGLLALYDFDADPVNYLTLGGLIWLAVIVTVGIRSITGAALAGLIFALVPALFTEYLPKSLGQIPVAAFGLGAVFVARNPEGSLALHARQFRQLFSWVANAASDRLAPSARPDHTDSGYPGIASATFTRLARESSVDPGPPVVSALGISVNFGGLRALSSVSIAVPPATIVGLLGPNGAGKSTLFDVITGLRTPTLGTVLLNGQDVTTASAEARARQGMARTFQHPQLFGDLTVAEHVILAHRVHQTPSRVWRDMFLGGSLRPSSREENDKVAGLLELLGLTALAQQPAHVLALGTRRLVDLARALALEPQVLLLDEPGAGLNPHERAQLAMAIQISAAERNLSVLLVEHDVEMVFGLSEFVYVLDFGVCIAQGSPAEVRSDSAVRAAYLGDLPPEDVSAKPLVGR